MMDIIAHHIGPSVFYAPLFFTVMWLIRMWKHVQDVERARTNPDFSYLLEHVTRGMDVDFRFGVTVNVVLLLIGLLNIGSILDGWIGVASWSGLLIVTVILMVDSIDDWEDFCIITPSLVFSMFGVRHIVLWGMFSSPGTVSTLVKNL